MSGFDNKLYLHNKKDNTKLCSYQTENGFVQTMESLKLKNKTIILLGFEKGLIELVMYCHEEHSFTKMGEFLS